LVLFEFLSQYLINLISAFGYPGIIFAMMMESACMPIPSEIIMPFAGFATQQGPLDFIYVGLAGSLGCLLGSMIAYTAGYYGGRPLLEKYGRYVLITKQEIDQAQSWFDRYGTMTVFIARLLPVIRTFISLPAGIARMEPKRFCAYSFFGSLPWCFTLAYAGVLLGRNWSKLESYWIYLDLLTILGIVILLLYFGLKVFKKPGDAYTLSDDNKGLTK
jgi:membrane protein DedA with SNARE-associated domain